MFFLKSLLIFFSSSTFYLWILSFLCTWCHNPIFTLGIFSSVGTQNETAQTEPIWPDRDPPHQKNLETGPGAHFPEFEQVWPTLTRFDQLWPILTRVDQHWPSRFDLTGTHHIQRTSKPGPKHISQSLERFDQLWPGLTKVWPKCWPDQKLDWADRVLTIGWSIWRASIRYFTGRKRTQNERVMGETVKIGPTLSQILLSVVDKIAYLGGNICA